MGELTLYYGTMEGGKTTKLLQDLYNYSKYGIEVFVMKPKVDNKGDNKIINRQNESVAVDLLVDDNYSFLSDDFYKRIANSEFILVDEAQFLTLKQAEDLWVVTRRLNKNVICYGLKSKFNGHTFETTAELSAKADQKHELVINCGCGKPAMFNARRVGGVYQLEGSDIVIDGKHEKTEYIPLCGDCFYEKVYKPNHLELNGELEGQCSLFGELEGQNSLEGELEGQCSLDDKEYVKRLVRKP